MTSSTQSPSHHWAQIALAAPLHAIVRWYRVSQERVDLRNMPAERLADVGLTKREVEWEVSRPFWNANRDT